MLTVLVAHTPLDTSKLLIFIPRRLSYKDVADEYETKTQTLVAINSRFPAAATLHTLWSGLGLDLHL